MLTLNLILKQEALPIFIPFINCKLHGQIEINGIKSYSTGINNIFLLNENMYN